MHRLAVLVVLTLLVASPAFAQKVYVDFDQDADFGGFRNFAFFDHEDNSLKTAHPLVHQRVVELLEQKMAEAGLEAVDRDPELYVTYHTSAKKEVRVETTAIGYTYGPALALGSLLGRALRRCLREGLHVR